MELILILLGAAGIGYLISVGSRTSVARDGGGGGGTEPHATPSCENAINTLPEPLRTSVQTSVASATATKESLMALAKVLDTCPYPGIKDQCAFVAACIRAEAAKKPGTASPTGGGSTVDDSTCTTMIEALPETTEDEKKLKTSIKAVWSSPVIIPAAVVTLADTIDSMADASSDATSKARLKLIAGCMRTKAAKAAGGTF